MALQNRRADRVFLSGAETKSGNESAPNTYKNSICRMEIIANMSKPQPTPMQEAARAKLGTGQFGKRTELQAIYTPFSINNVERLSDIAFLLSYFLGKADSSVVSSTPAYKHELKGLSVANLDLPTFSLEFGNGASNDSYAGCVINEFSLEIPVSSGNGKVNGTFSGFCNGHYVNAGGFTKLANGIMSSASDDTTVEPIVNGKACKVYIADSLESPLAVDFADADTDILSKVDLSQYINSIRIGGSNGLSPDSMLRGGGYGIINNWTRGVPSITFEVNLRKNVSIFDVAPMLLANTKKAVEIEFNGPVIVTTYKYALNLFLPVIQFTKHDEDDGTPISQTLGTEVFEDANGDAFFAEVQSKITTGYNA